MYSLSEILQNVGQTTTDALGKIVGGEIANATTDGQKGFSSKLPDWLNNFFSGVASGFTSTPGGQAVVNNTAIDAAKTATKNFLSTPIGWITIGLVVFILVMIFKGKK